jgi:hypothetical protein
VQMNKESEEVYLSIPGRVCATESAERITLPALGATRSMVAQNLWLAEMRERLQP